MLKTGSQNLSGVKSLDSEAILKQKDKYLESIESIKSAGIDIDLIASVILTDFKTSTESSTKAFFKVAKKGNEKQKLQFIKEYVVPRWILIEDKEENFADIRNFLDNKKFLTYLMGIYVSIHSTNLKENINELVLFIVCEMFYMTMLEVKTHIPEGIE